MESEKSLKKNTFTESGVRTSITGSQLFETRFDPYKSPANFEEAIIHRVI